MTLGGRGPWQTLGWLSLDVQGRRPILSPSSVPHVPWATSRPDPTPAPAPPGPAQLGLPLLQRSRGGDYRQSVAGRKPQRLLLWPRDGSFQRTGTGADGTRLKSSADSAAQGERAASESPVCSAPPAPSPGQSPRHAGRGPVCWAQPSGQPSRGCAPSVPRRRH